MQAASSTSKKWKKKQAVFGKLNKPQAARGK